VVGVEDLHAVDHLDVRPGDSPLAVLLQAQGARLAVRHPHHHLLEVEDDVGDVFHNVGQGGELVEGPLDLDRGDRRPLQRREQHPSDAVPQGDAEAALERLAGELAVERRQRLPFDLELPRPDEIAPVAGDERGLR
jgi:hypothetical protein